MTIAAGASSLDPAVALAEADALAEAGRPHEALDRLAALATTDDAVVARLAELRHAAFGSLEARGFDRWPVGVDDVDRSGPPCVPELRPDELDADVVRRLVLSHGCVLVRGLLAGRCEPFVAGIDRALADRERVKDGADETAWYRRLPLPRPAAKSLGRHWIAGGGGVLGCDSPRLLQQLLDAYTDVGLRTLVADYLGERPVLSANKCTMRRVEVTRNGDWHQDGAFLGAGVRALNIWVALNDCGVDSPGMDLVPKRFDHVVETGTGGAYFDWAVGPDTVAALSADAPVVRPRFEAGDALLFDDLYLHRTAIDPEMTRPRYAIESWFFARSDYPEGQVPLVW